MLLSTASSPNSMINLFLALHCIVGARVDDNNTLAVLFVVAVPLMADTNQVHIHRLLIPLGMSHPGINNKGVNKSNTYPC